MRRYVLICVMLLAPLLGIAQNTAFPEDHDDFIKEIDKVLKATKRDDAKLISRELIALWGANPLVHEHKDAIINTSNAMMKRKMRIYPHLTFFYESIINFVRSDLEPGLYKQWHQSLDQLLPSQKRGSHKFYDIYIRFSKNFFKRQSLFRNKAFEWVPQTEGFSFSFDSIPKLSIPELSLVGLTRGDTVRIYQTSGTYYPLSYTWRGTKGMINWKRAGLDTADVYATFGAYEMVLKQSIWTIPDVTFRYSSVLDRELKGSIEDKLVANYKPDITSYPRFNSESKRVQLKQIAEGIDFQGGIAVYGYKIHGKGTRDEPASLTFYKGQDSIAMKAFMRDLLLKRGEQISSLDAEVIMYLGEDSVYHPSLKLRYNVEQKLLTLICGEQGISATSFFDSFHNMETKAEALYWKTDEPTIDFRMLTSPDQNAATLESINYFEAAELQRWQGIADYNIVHEIKRLSEDNGDRVIYAGELAERLGLSSYEQLEILLFQLVEVGFIYYDKETQDITVKQKTFNYVFSNAEMIDYDVIKINSIHEKKNGELDLYTYDLNLNGVYNVILSDTQFVMFFPAAKRMTVKKNRDMTWAGTLFAGRMDMYGDHFNFSYEGFKVDLSVIDSFVVNIPPPGTDLMDQDKLIPINTPIMGITGTLYIDAPDNKSSKVSMPEYPILESDDFSYVYYNKRFTQRGAYRRDTFYYQIDPFRIESLDNFDIQLTTFSGKLVSAGIFPDIHEGLKVRPDDLSLGFVHITPSEGLPAYGGRGKFTDTLDLSNNGLIGSGVLNYLASDSKSSQMVFLPDSMRAFCEAFRVKKQTLNGAEFPNAHNTGVKNVWVPYEDVMYSNMMKTPFDIYDGESKLFGGLEVRPEGLFGRGNLDWAEATLKSDKFKFSSRFFDADTSMLTIKGEELEDIVFSASDINSHVDFDTRIGDFKSNSDDINIEFPMNKYRTSIREFTWDMKKKKIEFRPSKEKASSRFLSTHAKQDSLEFGATNATYDLVKYVIDVEGVDHIDVADSRVFPQEGKVIIERDADLKTLENASMISDTVNKYHKVYDATIDVQGKFQMHGMGTIDYMNISGNKQSIYLDSIIVERTKDDLGLTRGYGKIDSTKGFDLNPRLSYFGDVLMLGEQKPFRYDGYVQVQDVHPSLVSKWFSIEEDVRPDSLFPAIDSNTVNTSRNKIFVGLHMDKQKNELYPTLIDNKRVITDDDIFLSQGIMHIDKATKEVSVGRRSKILGDDPAGQLLVLKDAEEKIMGEGMIDFNMDMPLIDIKAGGTWEHSMKDTVTKFNVMLAISFPVPDNIMETMAYDVIELTRKRPNPYYLDPGNQKLIALFNDDSKRTKKNINEITRTAQFKKPGSDKFSLFFSQIVMEYDPVKRAYRSKGAINLAYIGNKAVHKNVEAYLEFGDRGLKDNFKFYLKAGSEDYYYMSYQNNILSFLSTYEKFNNELRELDLDKRKTKTNDNKIFVFQLGGSKRQAKRFVDEMKIFADGPSAVQPESPEEDEEAPEDPNAPVKEEETPEEEAPDEE